MIYNSHIYLENINIASCYLLLFEQILLFNVIEEGILACNQALLYTSSYNVPSASACHQSVLHTYIC